MSPGNAIAAFVSVVLAAVWTSSAAQPNPAEVAALEAQIRLARSGSTFWRHDKRPLTDAIDRLPPDRRGEWIVAAADLLLMWDTAEAAAWLAGHRDAADYEQWLDAALRAAFVPGVLAFHQFDERSMADLLGTLPSPPAAAVQAVAGRWGRKAPTETASWAMSLGNPAARSRAVASAVGAWTMIDPAAAERWALALPSGELRDQALAGHVAQSIASYGVIEPRVLAAFSSTATRRRALENTVYPFRFFGANEPDKAKALARDFIEDDALVRRIEADIDLVHAQRFTIPRLTAPAQAEASRNFLYPLDFLHRSAFFKAGHTLPAATVFSGTYTVTVTCAGETVTGSFTVERFEPLEDFAGAITFADGCAGDAGDRPPCRSFRTSS